MNIIVCPVRNGVEYTKAALPTFLAQEMFVNIILIDNDSSDGTGEWARSQPLSHWPQRPAKSVSASWNRALRQLFGGRSLFEQRSDYALIVNNDVLLKPETYRLLLEDGGEFVTATGVNTMEQFAQPSQPQNKRPHPDFSCFLIRRSCWEKVGPFDESYTGGYVEDCDYHVRMHRAGVDARCLAVPFFHAACGTIKSAAPEEAKLISQRADANRKRFFDKYGCVPGDANYQKLFDESSFGVDKVVTSNAKPL